MGASLSLRSLLLPPVLAGAALLTFAGTAAAHAALVSTSPADGEVVASAPAEVVLTFTEPVSLAGGDARVLDDAATVRSLDPVQSGSTVTIPLDADLPDGTYTVTWQVVSTDSHRIGGASVFHVGAATSGGLDPGVLGQGGAGWGIRFGSAALSGIAYGATLVAVGTWTFRTWVDRHPARRGGALFRAVTVRVAVLGLVSLVASVPFRIARVGGGLDALNDNELLSTELRGPIGQSAVVTAVALLLLALAIERGLPSIVAGLSGLVAIGGFALEGHTRGSHLRAAMIASDVVHMAAAAVWVGGLVALALAFRGPSDPDRLAGLVRRFSDAALVAVAVVAVTGVLMAWIVLPTAGEITSTGWGLALVVKVAIVVVLVALGAFNRWRLVPSTVDDAPADAHRRLSRIVLAELALLAAVVGTTAVLVTRSPIAATSDAVAAGPTTTLAPRTLVIELSDGSVAGLTVAPGRTGSNTITIELRDDEGRIVNPLETPVVELTQPALDIGPLRPDVTAANIGRYRVTADLPVAGDWEFFVRVRIGDFESVSGSTMLAIP